ncbi:translation elongation factor Ts [Candidatus Falkowbacteria bacterium]|jgi:elongation factor Ts|nr:translation elongation factor Ts [Candidatus Falkowbacteria bacterium]MBT6573849.1 translation elongation factor Ts [Candidatus Falkowbacteria bacterium]MBT7348539.1 translation elongation factor Ts [Candidatus Falkowbacteria bacterium]MBT7501077.1 translation elongation factor Ts [Candidatus Falkowbacteria bacterium]
MSDVQTITKLRAQTGAGMLDCKKALDEVNGDYDKAVDVLRKKGEAKAAKKIAERQAKEGIVYSYIHSNNKTGTIVELFCETDFVAKTDDFKSLAHDIALQIVAMSPEYVTPEQIPAEALEREKSIYREQLKNEGKPDEMIEKILEGKMNKYYEEVCLMKQLFIKDDKVTIEGLINQIIAKTGEKIEIGNFARYQI